MKFVSQRNDLAAKNEIHSKLVKEFLCKSLQNEL